MSFFEFPYTRTYSSDLGWLIRQLEWVTKEVQFKTIKYADPLAWDITSQYEQNTVVIDQNTGIAYLSTQPVPSGVSISNTDYWTVIFDLQRIIGQINNNLTYHNDGTSPTCTMALDVGDWILWQNELYKVLVPMAPGYAYIPGSNIEAHSVEELVNEYVDALYLYIGLLGDLTTSDKSSIVNAINSVMSVIGDLINLTTTDKTSIVNAINSVLSDLSGVIGDLNDLTTTDKTSIVNAINSVLSDLSGVIGDLNDLTTSDKTSIVNAINSVLSNLSGVIGDLNDLTTSDKTSIVNAINEIKKSSDLKIYNVLNFGAVGDGVTDDTAAIQATIDAAFNDGAAVWFPVGKYLITAPLYVQYVSLYGVNVTTGFDSDLDHVSVLFIKNVNTCIEITNGATIDGLAFYYPDQGPEGSPIVQYVPTIKYTNCPELSIKNCWFINSYVGISNVHDTTHASGRIFFDSIMGCAYDALFDLGEHRDSVLITNCFITFGVSLPNVNVTYYRANAIGVRINRPVDDLHISDCLFFGMTYAIRCRYTAEEDPIDMFKINNCLMDGVDNALRVEGYARIVHCIISNCVMMMKAYDLLNTYGAIVVATNAAQSSQFTLADCDISFGNILTAFAGLGDFIINGCHVDDGQIYVASGQASNGTIVNNIWRKNNGAVTFMQLEQTGALIICNNISYACTRFIQAPNINKIIVTGNMSNNSSANAINAAAQQVVANNIFAV